jgi:hypothetical protein
VLEIRARRKRSWWARPPLSRTPGRLTEDGQGVGTAGQDRRAADERGDGIQAERVLENRSDLFLKVIFLDTRNRIKGLHGQFPSWGLDRRAIPERIEESQILIVPIGD